jgi:hypothetical protein
MAETSDKFNPELCEEMTGYTFRDVIAMYEDYERMAKELEAIQNIGEYQRGWCQGRKDTMQAYGIKEAQYE